MDKHEIIPPVEKALLKAELTPEISCKSFFFISRSISNFHNFL